MVGFLPLPKIFGKCLAGHIVALLGSVAVVVVTYG